VLFAATKKLKVGNAGFAGWVIVINAGLSVVATLKKIGRSACNCCKSGAANQNNVSVWANDLLLKSIRKRGTIKPSLLSIYQAVLLVGSNL
jgi:hypothetical protein